MTFERATKGTFRYTEDGEDEEGMAFRTLYIRKNALATLGQPKHIEVSVRIID